ncbi:hypothetical protein JB92DRAFT_3119044 [Gautieria morchelliformis]|nr:hypothetical protein JB92DRAFT_3119044 [Gautieria morchelliformis]
MTGSFKSRRPGAIHLGKSRGPSAVCPGKALHYVGPHHHHLVAYLNHPQFWRPCPDRDPSLEASPLITYTGFWTEGSKANDSLSQSYDGSFRVTNSTGAQATLLFTGTGFSLFGAMRPNHGDYDVALDHGTSTRGSGTSAQPLFNQTLSQTYNLPYQQHTVVVTDDPIGNTPYFDLDFVQIERVVGGDNDTPSVFNIDDTSPLITYLGPWQLSPETTSTYNGTLHQVTESNSSFNMTFQGCCIELYGLYANAAFTVAIDGGPPMPMTGQDLDIPQEFWHPQTLLYVLDGLSETTNHTVVLTTTLASAQRPFSFDYSVVRSTQNLTSSALPPSPSTGTNSPTKTPLSAIIGASIGGVVLASLMVIGIIIWCRRRRPRPLSDMTADGSANQPQPSWIPWLRSEPASPPASVTAWYPPSEPQSEPLTSSMDPSEQTTEGDISSGIRNDGSPPNARFNRRGRSAKHRGDYMPGPAAPTDAATSSASSAPRQSSNSLNDSSIVTHTDGSAPNGRGSSAKHRAAAPRDTPTTVSSVPTQSASSRSNSSIVRSTGTQSRRAQRGSHRRGSTAVSSPATSHSQPATTRTSVPTQEEDAGRLYSADEPDTLPPAYNPGWNPR